MFENELTLYKAVMNKKEDIFHTRYEDAIVKIGNELGKTYPLIINGRDINTGSVLPVISPIDNRIIVGYVFKARKEHVKDAITSAKNSFKEWSKIDYKERVKIMRKAADIMSNNKYELAALISYENGKNRYEAVADVDEGIDFLRYYSNEMESNEGYTMRTNQCYPDEESYSVMRPYGVFVVIAPFNFPIAITTGMCAGALITGNTVVLKPSSNTPISAVKLINIFKEAGIIDGAINLIVGIGSEISDALLDNDVDGIVFTGSREVGFSIYKKANEIKPRPVITEMGGKNACIVSKHANIDKAINGVIKAAYGYSGQKCSACSRLIIDKEIKDEFIKKLISFAETLKIGNPIERDTFLGPIINRSAYERYKDSIEIIKNDGKVLFGGRVLDNMHGYYVEPALVELARTHKLLMEELFLPILAVIEYKEFDEALEIFNDTEYGLTGGIYSNNESEVIRFFDEANSGVLYANRERSATTGAIVGAQPFVGWKYSGISGKGTGSKYYLPLFMREQSRTISK